MAPTPPPRSVTDTEPDTVARGGPWASRAWLAWRDRAAAGSLVDSALADLSVPRPEWLPEDTWEFVSEELAARAAAGDTTPASALLVVLSDSALADSIAGYEHFQSAVGGVFEGHPAYFAEAYAALPPEARDHAVGALLGGWLRLALDGRAPIDPPSARLAELAPSVANHALQARLAMREAPYLKALRDALESRRGVVT